MCHLVVVLYINRFNRVSILLQVNLFSVGGLNRLNINKILNYFKKKLFCLSRIIIVFSCLNNFSTVSPFVIISIPEDSKWSNAFNQPLFDFGLKKNWQGFVDNAIKLAHIYI